MIKAKWCRSISLSSLFSSPLESVLLSWRSLPLLRPRNLLFFSDVGISFGDQSLPFFPYGRCVTRLSRERKMRFVTPAEFTVLVLFSCLFFIKDFLLSQTFLLLHPSSMQESPVQIGPPMFIFVQSIALCFTSHATHHSPRLHVLALLPDFLIARGWKGNKAMLGFRWEMSSFNVLSIRSCKLAFAMLVAISVLTFVCVSGVSTKEPLKLELWDVLIIIYPKQSYYRLSNWAINFEKASKWGFGLLKNLHVICIFAYNRLDCILRLSSRKLSWKTCSSREQQKSITAACEIG